MIFLSLFVAHLFVLAIPSLGEEFLSCYSQGCICTGTKSAELHCNFTDAGFHVPATISRTLRHIKIHGTNYSIYISDQTYNDSWSVLESLEINGQGRSRHNLKLPRKFTIKLQQLKLFRIRNAGLVSIDERAFSNMNKMRELDLSNNELLNINAVASTFKGYTANKIKTLNISGTHRSKTALPFTTFWSFPLESLLNLDISWTKSSIQDLGFTYKGWSSFLKYRDFTKYLLRNLVTLNISGTSANIHHVEYTNCTYRMPFFKSFVYLEDLRMDYWALKQPDSNNLFAFENGCYIFPPSLQDTY